MTKILDIIFIFLFSISILNATIINVPNDQPTIQAGINHASEGDTVLVRPGTYTENIDYNGKNIVIASTFILSGYTSIISQTIIDGNQNGSVVTFSNNETLDAKMIGFTVKNGGLTSGFISGGGINCTNANPIISDCIIKDNYAYTSGAGIYCDNSNMIISECKIVNNNCYDYGGGIMCGNSNLRILNTVIKDNSAYAGGD